MSTVAGGQPNQLKAVTQAYEPGSVFKTVSTHGAFWSTGFHEAPTTRCSARAVHRGRRLQGVGLARTRRRHVHAARDPRTSPRTWASRFPWRQVGFDKLYDHIKTLQPERAHGGGLSRGRRQATLLAFRQVGPDHRLQRELRPGHRRHAAADHALLRRHRRTTATVVTPALPDQPKPQSGRRRPTCASEETGIDEHERHRPPCAGHADARWSPTARASRAQTSKGSTRSAGKTSAPPRSPRQRAESTRKDSVQPRASTGLSGRFVKPIWFVLWAPTRFTRCARPRQHLQRYNGRTLSSSYNVTSMPSN